MRKTRAQTVMRAWQDYRRAIGIPPALEEPLKMAFMAGAAWTVTHLTQQITPTVEDIRRQANGD